MCLINNVIEIRTDAYKYITQMQRPIGQQASDIGIWYKILEGMTYLSVMFNAFTIALTSDFIPKLVYYFYYSKDFNDSPVSSMENYVNFTLSSKIKKYFWFKKKLVTTYNKNIFIIPVFDTSNFTCANEDGEQNWKLTSYFGPTSGNCTHQSIDTCRYRYILHALKNRDYFIRNTGYIFLL